MTMQKTLCYYFPTTVVIVDDNKQFLENISDALSGESNYKLFDSPDEALKFIKTKNDILPTAENYLSPTEDFASGEMLNVNIPQISKLINNKQRYDFPTVVIVDHAMPEMSGIDFCRALADNPIRKIMLTGAADHQLAVQAFNDGSIHKFITKDSSNMFDEIDQAIHDLQIEYFAAQSNLLIKNITSCVSSLIVNEQFQDFFKSFITENAIKEFYLLDATGSFLCVNSNGEKLILYVQTSHEIENYCQIAKEHDADSKIIEGLANKEKIVCLLFEEDFNQPVDKWSHYLKNAIPIPGLKDCYYAKDFFFDAKSRARQK